MPLKVRTDRRPHHPAAGRPQRPASVIPPGVLAWATELGIPVDEAMVRCRLYQEFRRSQEAVLCRDILALSRRLADMLRELDRYAENPFSPLVKYLRDDSWLESTAALRWTLELATSFLHAELPNLDNLPDGGPVPTGD